MPIETTLYALLMQQPKNRQKSKFMTLDKLVEKIPLNEITDVTFYKGGFVDLFFITNISIEVLCITLLIEEGIETPFVLKGSQGVLEDLLPIKNIKLGGSFQSVVKYHREKIIEAYFGLIDLPKKRSTFDIYVSDFHPNIKLYKNIDAKKIQ